LYEDKSYLIIGAAIAATLLREISKDEHERALLRSRRMYETDKESDRLTITIIIFLNN